MKTTIKTQKLNRYNILRKKWLLFFLSALIMVSLLSFSGCKTKTKSKATSRMKGVDPRKPISWGQDRKIYIFTDDNVWQYAEHHLRENLERFYWTTENEQYFEIERANFKDIKQFYRFRNLLFLANLDSEKEVSKFVQERLTDNVLDSVKKDGVGLFSRHNLWADQQLVVFMLGNTEDNLLRYNILGGNSLFEMFKDKLYGYVENRIYGIGVHPDSFFRSFIWSIKIPKNYVVYKREDQENFISFLARRKDAPDRYLSVYHEEIAEQDFNLKWVYKTRADLAWKYYDEDEFTFDDSKSEKIRIAGFDGIKISGRWQNKKYAVGGAFQSFAFYDSEGERGWIIDNSVFYPEDYKLPALIELEVISRKISLKQNNKTTIN